MTFDDVIVDVLIHCGQGRSGDFEKLIKMHINGVYREVLEVGSVPHEQREFTFSTVADTSKYGLPLYVKSVLNIEDPANRRNLLESTARSFDLHHPGSTESGTPVNVYPFGVKGVQKLPSTTGTCTLLSSSSADTGSNYKVRVTGFNASSNLVTELVTMAGTSSVATSNSYLLTLGLERVTKSPASGITFTGDISVRDNAGNQIAHIPTWWMSPDYYWIEFYPIPDAAITYTIRCEMRRPPLVNAADWPEFDQDFHDLLVFGTTRDVLPTLGQSAIADRHRVTFQSRLAQFKERMGYRSSAYNVFVNVQTQVGNLQRPGRPLISGVDIGLASYS